MNEISILHGIAGYVIFATGLLQYVLKKGGKRHRLIGKIYFFTWFVLVISGASIGGIMITFLGLFGLYYAVTGIRFAVVKAQPNTLMDKAITVAGFACSIAILFFAGKFYMKGNVSFATIFLVFGLLFGINSFKDVRTLFFRANKHPLASHKMYLYFEHYTRFTISFIAALTAFSAIQNITPIVAVNWMLPTVLGTVYLFYVGKKYRKQFKID